MDKDVPLIVPEVNPNDLKKHKNIISNPNCSTIQLVLPLKPLHDKYKIKRVIVLPIKQYQARENYQLMNYLVRQKIF